MNFDPIKRSMTHGLVGDDASDRSGRQRYSRLEMHIQRGNDLDCSKVSPIAGLLQNRSCAKRLPVMLRLDGDLSPTSTQDQRTFVRSNPDDRASPVVYEWSGPVRIIR